MKKGQMMLVLKKHKVGVAFVGTCVGILAILLAVDKALEGSNPWGTTLNYTRCETTYQDNFIREPANTLSNLAFFFLGIYVLIAAVYDFRYVERPSEPDACMLLSHLPFVQAGFGVGLLFLGVTSFYYHACAGDRRISGQLDVTGVYVVIWSLLELFTVFLLCLLGFIHSETSMKKVAIVYWVMYFLGIGVSVNYRTIFQEPLGDQNMKFLMLSVFGVLIVEVLSSVFIGRWKKFRPNYDIGLILLSGFFLIVAVVSWYPEEVDRVCSPIAIELHALWHAALGVCLFAIFVFARTLGNNQVLQFGFFSHLCFPVQDPFPKSAAIAAAVPDV